LDIYIILFLKKVLHLILQFSISTKQLKMQLRWITEH